jgi:hypothetical protein
MALRDTSADHLLSPAPSVRRLPLAAVIAVTVAVLALAAAVMMWLHYGTAVFFEMVAAGIAACF